MSSQDRADIGRENAIKRVTFGLRTEEAHKTKIIEALKDTGIPIHAMRVAKFGLISEPIDEIIMKAKPVSKKSKKAEKTKKAKSKKAD